MCSCCDHYTYGYFMFVRYLAYQGAMKLSRQNSKKISLAIAGFLFLWFCVVLRNGSSSKSNLTKDVAAKVRRH